MGKQHDKVQKRRRRKRRIKRLHARRRALQGQKKEGTS